MGKRKGVSFIEDSIAEAEKPVRGLAGGQPSRSKSRRKKKKR